MFDQVFDLGHQHVGLVVFKNAVADQAAGKTVDERVPDFRERDRIFLFLVVHDGLYRPRERFAGKGMNEVDGYRRFTELVDQHIEFVDERFVGVEMMHFFGFIDFGWQVIFDE